MVIRARPKKTAESVIPDKETEDLRKALFQPCESEAEMHAWIECFLGIDLPDEQVEETSTATPMSSIWRVYNVLRLRRFDMPEAREFDNWNQCMAYSSRDSFKTLGAAILEVMVVLHLSLSVAHMAAIEPQAKKAQSYVKDFFRLPFLQDYVTVKNEKRTDVVRYRDRVTGDNIPELEFQRLPTWRQLQYDRRANYITIVICTLSGANSEHVPFMVIDEIDVIRGESVRAFEEAKLIPSAWKGTEPLTLFTSTRKTSFGLVQKELDEAPVTDLQVWHWNILDVTERCPPTRHLPEEPKITIYYQNPERQTRGSAISEETFKLLPAEKQELYRKTTGFKGCLQNCKIFFACRGQLAIRQMTRHNQILKSVNATTQLFKKVSPGMANAQLLCGKPSEEGLIYPHLDNQVHLISAQEMAELIDGGKDLETGFPLVPHPEIQTKNQLVAFMHAQGMEFAQGLDHGHTHNFAVTTFAKDVNRAFVIDCLAMPGLEMDHKIAHMQALNKTLGINPRVWPDMAGKDQNATLKKHFRLQTWKKGPDSVVAGIEIVRSLIYPSFGAPNIYFLAGDEGVELLFLRLSKYHWEVDDAGRSTSQPHKDEDDEADSLRYGIMNEFKRGPNSGLKVAAETRAPTVVHQEPTQSNYLSHFINQALGQSDGELLYRGDGQDPVGKGKSGGFLWDI